MPTIKMVNFIVTITCDDEHEFDNILAELENAVVCIGNSYKGEIALSEGELVEVQIDE